MEILKNILNITHSSFRLNFNPLILLFISRNGNFIKIGIVGINPYFFPRIGMNKEVDNTELSHVGVGHTDS